MKRTTYILMGLLVSGLVVIIVTIVTMAVSNQGKQNNGVFLGAERTEINLEDVHVIKMSINEAEGLEMKRVIVCGEVEITTPLESERNSISYPKSQYLTVNKKGDTLFVAFDLNANNVPHKVWNEDPFLVVGADVRLSIDSLTTIISTVNGIKLNLKEMQTDSLFICAGRQDVLLDSCQLRSFSLVGSGLSLRATGSKIENFYLDLDGIWDWAFENSVVGTEYLTGSSHRTNDLQKGECRRVIWTPKDKDARLQMTLRERVELNIVPE